jgi:hypothetical protein
MSAAWSSAGMGARRLIAMFLILVNSSLCGIHFCHTSSHRHKTDDQILSQILSSSEDDIAKTTKFSHVIDKFAFVKARKVTL